MIKGRSSNGETKAIILEKAEACFAKFGFHGTGLNEICQKARVNKRMIYHYFGDKETLYRMVHRKGWDDLALWFARELLESKRAPAQQNDRELLLEAIRIFHDFIASHQLFVRLLIWDGLEGGKISRQLWKEIRGPIYRQMENLITSAQTSGVLPRHLKANHLVISFMGAISLYFSHAHTLIDIFQEKPLSKSAVEERKEQMILLFHTLMPSNGNIKK